MPCREREGKELKLFSVLLYSGEPCLVGRVFPTHDRKEGLLQRLRNRTWRAGSYAAIVDLSHRRQLGSGPGHEDFIRNIHIIAREALLHHGDTLLPRQIDDGTSADRVENRGERRRLALPFTHNEYILPCPLGDIALGIEKNGFIVPVRFRFPLRENRVHVVAGDLP